MTATPNRHRAIHRKTRQSKEGSVSVSEGHQCFSTRVAKRGLHQAFNAGTLPWCKGRGINAQ